MALSSTLVILVIGILLKAISHIFIPQESWFWTGVVCLSLCVLALVSPKRKMSTLLKQITTRQIILALLLALHTLLPAGSMAARMIRWMSSFIAYTSWIVIFKHFPYWKQWSFRARR